MKKILSLSIIIVCCFFTAMKTFAMDYTDLSQEHWAYKQIEALTDENIVVGYPDKTFHPDENVTRAEFATMVIKAVGQKDAQIKETIDFDDINQNFWAWDMIQRAVTFDIVKKSPDNKFNPDATVTRAQALTFVVNSLSTEHITEAQAKEAIAKAYSDYELIPEWVIITAGKAEIMGVIAKVPGKEQLMEAERPATRAELAVFLYNLKEQVKVNANKKLKEAMAPKKAEGIVLNEATVDGNIATIPAGTVLPVVMLNHISSQKSTLGAVFMSKTPKNFVTKENYLLIVENSPIAGQVLDVKIARWFIRNGKVVLETKSIKTPNNEVAKFSGLADTELKFSGFWQKLFRTVFKGAKITVKEGQVVDIKLLQPIKVNLSNTTIIE